MSALLTIENLRKRFGGVVATDGASLDVRAGEAHALIGPNGAGKTTLIAQLAGEVRPDGGVIRFDGADLTRRSAADRARRGLARTFQITQLLGEYTARDHVALAVQVRAGHSFRFLADARADARLTAPAMALLAECGLADRAGTRAADLSHGERKQLELAIALATGPRLLLLDEPMAGLGPSETAAMIAMLARLKGRLAMLLVEHDMDAVFALADRVSVLVNGRLLATGAPQAIRDDPRVREAYLGASEGPC